MANEPVQVVLNPETLRTNRETSKPGDNGHDFFANRDEVFRAHRDALAKSLRSVLQLIESPTYVSRWGGLAYVLVSMRPEAIAKSHRPTSKLFRPAWTPHAGTRGIGEPLYAVVPSTLRKVIAQVESAEVTVRTKVLPTGEVKPAPSRSRVEVGAISSVRTWSEADKRDFSAEVAAAWLQRQDTGGDYFLELFPAGPSVSPEVADARSSCAAQLASAITEHGSLRPIGGARGVERAIALRVERQGNAAPIEARGHLGRGDLGEVARRSDVSEVAVEHESLLATVGANPLVRQVMLPPRVQVPEASAQSPAAGLELVDFDRDLEGRYPRVGVIDGGIAGPVTSWVDERWSQLADGDRDASHGTFIAGLLAFGGDQNVTVRHQARGCVIFDIDVLPADPSANGASFGAYYPAGIRDFMDEVEDAIRHYVTERDVKVFNFSINVISASPRSGSSYGYAARRLDQLAQQLDIVVVIAAGNLETTRLRREWPDDDAEALSVIATSVDDLIGDPAESLYNVAVSALNPPGVGVVEGVLARYSRRGPGLRGATKPDFAQVGGAGTDHPDLGSGLVSVNEYGHLVTAAGTSFAAPLVARELAELYDAIEGPVSREMLLALAIHHSIIPSRLGSRTLAEVSRELVGFGVPNSTRNMLEGNDSEITLVFSDTLQPNGIMRADFAWPASLVQNGNKCRGHVRMTVVARPHLAYEHGDERVRVNIEPKLMQQKLDGGWSNKLDPAYYRLGASIQPHERILLRESMKWHGVKTFERRMMGLGPTTNWRFEVDYLTRADEAFPLQGVPFTAILTIGDPTHAAPVFQEMRQTLNALNIRTADVRTAVRSRARV
jgi:subtilisin family serine protease